MWRRRLPVLLVLAAVAVACGNGSDSPSTSAAARVPEEPPPAAAPAQRQGVGLKRVGSFDAPVYVTAPPGDRRRVFVVERAGTIRLIRDGRTLARPFLDLRSRVLAGGEQGLLSMAFAPDYRRSGRFYVSYTDRNGDSRVVQYRRGGANRARPGSARGVLFQDQPESNHNGGLIVFGPDGHLYVGLGDGGGRGDRHGARGNGQDLGTLLGKILRIDPRRRGGYRVPRDNPFVGRSGARPEIYAYGLRNPWRFSFDRETGDLAIGDVGQSAVEEIDFVRDGDGAGANFGWRVFEGSRRYTQGESAPGHVRPVLERNHADGWCSITGGVVVRDPRVPGLAGRYVFGDYCRPVVAAGTLDTPTMRNVSDTGLRVEGLVSFGEDARGRVYAVSINGPVHRLVAR